LGIETDIHKILFDLIDLGNISAPKATSGYHIYLIEVYLFWD
jgi:hypothetical protein